MLYYRLSYFVAKVCNTEKKKAINNLSSNNYACPPTKHCEVDPSAPCGPIWAYELQQEKCKRFAYN